MVCRTCHGMLYGRNKRHGTKSAFDIEYEHHKNARNLESSADNGCFICRVLVDRLKAYVVSNPRDVRSSKLDTQYLTANISPVPDRKDTYRLDIRIYEQVAVHRSKPVASFILIGNDDTDASYLSANPISASTSDPAVFDLVKGWLDECRSTHSSCNQMNGTFYPTRLIKVGSSGEGAGIVQLVSRKDGERRNHEHPTFSGRYVTLSHRWGQANFIKLSRNTLNRFQTAMYMVDLPLTFQHAITIARMLGVEWIWIDALCIIQDDEDDWMTESASMKQVYMNSSCNISATAAIDSASGMFRSRDTSTAWAQTVTLRVNFTRDEPFDLPCTVLDLSFWEKSIETAPVNRRSWVLQERLLAPRVLHWCTDQVAFECRHLERAECRPQGLPHLQEMRGSLIEGARFKKIDPAAGKDLRVLRLRREGSSGKKELQDMINQPKPKWLYYEIWKRVVDEYSTMELSNAEDRLIALSGIARMMADKMRSEDMHDEYIAGLWQRGLASQLLWYVNEADGAEPQPLVDLRPKNPAGQYIYRAPTFSWASIESPRGITFAVSTQGRHYISVEVVRLIYKSESDNFGILQDGYVVIKGVLRRIVLTDSYAEAQERSRPKGILDVSHYNHFVWKALAVPRSLTLRHRQSIRWKSLIAILVLLVWSATLYLLIDFPAAIVSSSLVTTWCLLSLFVPPPLPNFDHTDQAPGNRWRWRLTREGVPYGQEYSVIYLDSPATQPSIFGPEGEVYVIPALQTADRLICIMVQATKGDYGVRYKRIGITRVLTTYEKEVSDLVTAPGNNKLDHGRYYFGPEGRKSGESTICII